MHDIYATGYSAGWQRGMADAADEMDAYSTGCGSNLSEQIRQAAALLRRLSEAGKRIEHPADRSMRESSDNLRRYRDQGYD